MKQARIAILRLIAAVLVLGPVMAMAAGPNTPLEVVEDSSFGTHMWHWLGFAISVAAGAACAPIGWWLAALALKIRSRRKATPPKAAANAKKAAAFLMFALITGVIEAQFQLTGPPQRIARIVLDSLTIIGMAALLLTIWDVASSEISARAGAKAEERERLLLPVVRNLVKGTVVVVCCLLIIADIWQVNVAALVASLGIGGVVLALAAKDSVENVFGSVTMLFDESFTIGDWIKVGDVEGVVEEINLRSTKIHTFGDTIVTLPNSTWIKASIENFSRPSARRTRLTLQLSYANEPAKVEEFCGRITEAARLDKEVDPAKTSVRVGAMGESSMTVMMDVWLRSDSYVQEQEFRSRLMLKAFDAGKALGIHFINP